MKEFIYCLKDPRDNQPKYIGKSKDPKKRLQEHIYESKNKKTKKERWINKLLKLNLKPILNILMEIEEGEHFIWEPFFIKKYKDLGFKLVNDDNTGLGTISGKSLKTLKKEIEKSKIKILQYSADGEYISTYNSMREAALKTNISHANISRCCNGKYKHAGGFIFKKCSDKNEIKKIKHINARPKEVLEIGKNGEILATYKSISEASKKTNIDSGNISKVCNGKMQKIKSKVFKFKT